MTGSIGDAINAQNVKLSVNSGELIGIYNISLVDESPMERRNTRAGSIDTPSFNMVEVTSECTISSDVYTVLTDLRKLSTKGALTSATFSIAGTPWNDSATAVTAAGSFILRRLELLAQERGNYNVRITMRIDTSGVTYSP